MFRLFGDSGVFTRLNNFNDDSLNICEVTPKTFAANYAEKVALPASIILKFLRKFFIPWYGLFNFFSNSILKLFGVEEKRSDD